MWKRIALLPVLRTALRRWLRRNGVDEGAAAELRELAQSLREIGMLSAVDLFATYAGNKTELAPWLQDAQINRDRNLRLQYLAGRGLNLYRADVIFADMLNYAREPDGIFTGSERQVQSLLQKIRAAQGRAS